MASISTTPARPLPNPLCPLCGGPNGCEPARLGSFDVACWCAGVSVSRAALARVPSALQGSACLCRSCALAPLAEDGAGRF